MHAGPHDGKGPPPPCGGSGGCPMCPCAWCGPAHAAMGILPQEAVRIAYARLLSTIAAPPAHLGPLVWRAGSAGQPRAPPVLI
jgi:hypothetical protein